MRQGIVNRTKRNIIALSKLKKNGRRVGALKFKSRIASIPLNQFGGTHRIIGQKYVAIQNIKQPLRVTWLQQIPKGAELASATLEVETISSTSRRFSRR